VLPLLAGLAWCLRTRWPPVARLMGTIEREVAPVFRGIGVPGLALLATLAGVGEEALFRGVLQPWAAGALSPWPAAVLVGIVFGAMHPVSRTYVLLAALAGAYFGALLVLTDNLLVPIVAHAGYDLVALLVLARLKPAAEDLVGKQSSFSPVLPPSPEPTMSVTATHAPGTFAWADLGTPDPAAARRFYTGLFRWTFEDRPIGNGEYYTMLLQNGKTVAALYAQQDDERSGGLPPHWLSYLIVESADRSAARAAELGGTVLAPPFDVMAHGRMAVIQDPTGGVVAFWEPRDYPGAGLLGEPGALRWNELCTRDVARAGAFYADLLGWARETMPMPGFEYTLFKRGDQFAGGMMAIQPEWGDMPPHWEIYFAVTDCDATAASAAELGGSVMKAPADIPGVGRFAVLRDPQGATFSVLQDLPKA
jgi:predicted enzyme related to lactoylglutathione lyase